jgi:DNA processing protein
MEENRIRLFLAINRVSFLRPREKLLLAELADTLTDRLFRLSRGEMERVLGRRLRTRLWEGERHLGEAERDLELLTRGGIQCIFYPDVRYPPQLREIFDPPLVLYFRGDLPDPELPLVAVVGTRLPSGFGRSQAYRLGYELAGRGIPTVSGLARGIDFEAHRGTLDGGGKTLAVLGCGIDNVYPRSSRKLAARMLEAGGAILSEYPPGTPPAAYRFPERNRIISGLARSVVVVQAPERSGALITADYALDQGRDLLVHRAGLGGIAGRGTLDLHGAGARAITGAGDILEEWDWPPPEAAAAKGEAELEILVKEI